MKKLLSVVLSFIMLMTMLPTFAITASAANATNSLKISGDGILTWDAFGDTGVYSIDVTEYGSGAGAVTDDTNITGTQYNIQSLLDRHKIESGRYRVYVASEKKNSSGTMYPVSSNSISFSYTSSLSKLPAPQNIDLRQEMVYWDAVPYATHYIVSAYDSDGYLRYNKVTEKTESYKPAYSNYVTITATADGYRDSNPTESEHSQVIPDDKILGGGVAPYNLQMSNDGVLSWNAFGDTGVYEIDLTYHKDGNGLVLRIPDIKSTSVNVREALDNRKIDNGIYTIQVRTTVASSNYATYYYTSLLPKLSEPQNVSDNYSIHAVTWDKVPNADYYKVSFFDFEYNPIKTTETASLSASIPSNAGSVTVVAASYDNYRDSAPAESFVENMGYGLLTLDFNGAGFTSRTEPLNRFVRPINLYNPTRNHYIFDGWYTAPVGGEKVDYFTTFEEDTTIYAHWVSDGTATEISTVDVNGSIEAGETISDELTIANSAIEAYFSFSKDGKSLPSNAKATYGNYSCTINLFAADGFRFTDKTVLNFDGKSYKPENLMNNGEIAVFEIPNIYVECPHTSASWLYDTTNHWKICSTCKAKINEGTHNYSESVSGKTVTYTCRVCGFTKSSSIPETRTWVYYSMIDLGTALVGDKIPTTAKVDYARISSVDSTKYYDFADIQSVTYSTTGTFKNAKTIVTVVLKAKNNYYFDSTSRGGAGSQYTEQSHTASADGTTLTVEFSFTPYTPADVTLTLPEFTAGKTYAEIAKETQFKINGVAVGNYNISIKKAGESSAVLGTVADGTPSESYLSTNTIQPNTEYEFKADTNIGSAYGKSLTITNKNVAVITDSYYGEYIARIEANYTSTEGHNYDAGTITKQATCTEDGSITFKCTDTGCKSTKTTVIPAKGHQASTTYEIPATCIDEGKTAGEVCSRCDTVLSGRKPIAPTGEHYYSVQLAPEVKPTCNADGKTAIIKCGNCNAVTGGEVIKSTGKHTAGTPVKENVVAATCGKAGSYDEVTYCTGCKTEMSRVKKTTPATGNHSYTTVSSTTKATPTADGKIVKKCACGKTQTTTIKKASGIKLSATSYTYDAKTKKPTVTVKDSAGNTISTANYTVKYSNAKSIAVGAYKVTVTFKGSNYSGSKTLSYTIKPKSTTISSLTAASKGFTVKWKKQATQTTGYQIQIATDSGFTKGVKNYTVSKNSTVSKKITKLTGGKKYYVRIRTYKTVSGTKYYSSWSAKKYVTTKK